LSGRNLLESLSPGMGIGGVPMGRLISPLTPSTCQCGLSVRPFGAAWEAVLDDRQKPRGIAECGVCLGSDPRSAVVWWINRRRVRALHISAAQPRGSLLGQGPITLQIFRARERSGDVGRRERLLRRLRCGAQSKLREVLDRLVSPEAGSSFGNTGWNPLVSRRICARPERNGD